MSYTLAKELAAKEVDARLRSWESRWKPERSLQRMAYAVPHKRFMESKGKHTTTFPLGTADLKAQTLLSEYRISKARKELRSKVTGLPGRSIGRRCPCHHTGQTWTAEGCLRAQ